MITIYLNDEKIQIENNINLFDLLNKKKLCHPYQAVAINRRFIAKSEYETHQLNEDDKIDIVLPMQGG